MKCSPLNQHLFDMKVIDNATCACGRSNEDTNYYLFECQNYTEERHIFDNLDQRIQLNIETFLHGNNRLPNKMVEELFGKVEEYINNTGRFKRENH